MLIRFENSEFWKNRICHPLRKQLSVIGKFSVSHMKFVHDRHFRNMEKWFFVSSKIECVHYRVFKIHENSNLHPLTRDLSSIVIINFLNFQYFSSSNVVIYPLTWNFLSLKVSKVFSGISVKKDWCFVSYLE